MVIDGDLFGQLDFIKTGVGAHGLYPSRDGTKLYVSNRGTHSLAGAQKGQGSVSVIDFASRKVVANWTVPGGGSPDMGNLCADGKWLWLSGRYDGVIYAFNTDDGSVKSIPVGGMPHGLTVWPQPGPLFARPYGQHAVEATRRAIAKFRPCRSRPNGPIFSPLNSPRWRADRLVVVAISINLRAHSRICPSAKPRRRGADRARRRDHGDEPRAHAGAKPARCLGGEFCDRPCDGPRADRVPGCGPGASGRRRRRSSGSCGLQRARASACRSSSAARSCSQARAAGLDWIAAGDISASSPSCSTPGY